MKRITSLFVAAVISAVIFTALPLSAAPNPGDPLGWVLNSDVTAYIDEYPIRSYNINGYTYIVAEDLMSYGFRVDWLGSELKLVIRSGRTASPSGYTATYEHTANTKVPGTHAFQYLYTNITTWIDDKQITGYNIGGNTCICMDDLAEVFAKDYIWDPATTSLSLNTKQETAPASGSATAVVAPVPTGELSESDISITLKVPRNGTYNNYASLIVKNNSAKAITLPKFVSINGYLCNTDSSVDIKAGSSATVSYYRAILKNQRFDDKHYDMYLDNNSTGYVVMEWDGEQYYAEYGVKGIVLFYKGNVNGPA